MKKSRVIIIAFILCALYMLYALYLRQGDVNKIYQIKEYNEIRDMKCKSTVIVVDGAPLSRFSLKKIWLRNSNNILKKWAPLTNDCDGILFLRNKRSSPHDRSELHYWMGDDYYCLKGRLGNDQCILKEDQLFIIQLRKTTLDDEKVGVVDRKPIYIHFINYGG
ncbi:hypothetical protein [Raoultella terrigena]|uniref:hypothetical protein n=1 Tax=Raoultella terrigena TaxID=577 RepID=UPI001F519C2C|nr:hypothetical protein [Raoultella terrigena]MCI1034734.1 hypothetical protein [Raoultella terrigena]